MLCIVQENGNPNDYANRVSVFLTKHGILMFKLSSFLLLMLLFLLVGCEAVMEPAPAAGALAPEAAVPASKPLVQTSKASILSARGGAHFTVPPDVFGSEVGNVLTFNARKTADGTVSGHYNYHQTFQGELFKFNGTVTCMNVYDGNRAKIGGIVELSNDATLPPGVFIWWSVIDNGQGASAPPDASTIIGAGDEAANEAFCNSPAPPRFGPWEIDGGNFQVDD